jgi:hypothetical protein
VRAIETATPRIVSGLLFFRAGRIVAISAAAFAALMAASRSWGVCQPAFFTESTARVAQAESSAGGGVRIGLMIIQAPIGARVDQRRVQTGTRMSGVEAQRDHAPTG